MRALRYLAVGLAIAALGGCIQLYEFAPFAIEGEVKTERFQGSAHYVRTSTYQIEIGAGSGTTCKAEISGGESTSWANEFVGLSKDRWSAPTGAPGAFRPAVRETPYAS